MKRDTLGRDDFTIATIGRNADGSYHFTYAIHHKHWTKDIEKLIHSIYEKNESSHLIRNKQIEND